MDFSTVLFILLAGLVALFVLTLISYIIRRLFNLDRGWKDLLGPNKHVNDHHKKVDFFTRLGLLVAFILIIANTHPYLTSYQFLIMIVAGIIVTDVINIYFHLKYESEFKKIGAIISNSVVIITATVVIVYFDLLQLLL